MRQDRAGTVAGAVGLALAGAIMLSGCSVLSSFGGAGTGSAESPSGQGTAAEPPGSVAPPSAVSPTAAGLDKARFDQVGRQVAAAKKHPRGSDFTEALQQAGFPADAMQLTADTTSIGLTPGSFQFSVLLGDSCLIGQYGPGVGGYRSITAAPLATGGCLVGATVPVR